MPAKIDSSIASRPASVPGILMKMLQAARECRSATCSIVAFASSASSGETSSETQPSTPSVRSWIGSNSPRRVTQVRQRQLEEQLLGLEAALVQLDDLLVVGVAAR